MSSPTSQPTTSQLTTTQLIIEYSKMTKNVSKCP